MSDFMNIRLFFSEIFLLALIFQVCEGKNYCIGDVCDNIKQPIPCQYKLQEPASHCINYETTIRTEEDKQAVVEKINSRRNKVASGEIRSLPSAENLLKVEWNDDLATSAQYWANQCVRHNVPDLKDYCLDYSDTLIGQNIATIYGEAPGLTPTALVDVWYMELLNANTSLIMQYEPSAGPDEPHYDYFTQLVWAETSQVGCGGIKFIEFYQDSNRTVYRLVCNFAPSGNLRGQPVYSPGPPCTGCPNNMTCHVEYKSLCGANEDKVEEDKIDRFAKTTMESQTTTRKICRSCQDYHDPLESFTQMADMDDDFFPIDHVPQTYDINKQIITTTTQRIETCKDVWAIDKFVDLLKKKLGNDPLFRELVRLNSTLLPGLDEVYTDPTVEVFINRVYSKKTTATTTKFTDGDFVNSTLLADLVEAVIFRNSDRRVTGADPEILTPQPVVTVSPVRIKAKLPESNPSQEFSGHYFFPEDEETGEITTSDDHAESEYDATNSALSDVVLEIEDIKKNRETMDFLDEILESETATESTVVNMGSNKNKRNVNTRKKKCIDNMYPSKCTSIMHLNGYRSYSYSNLLKRLANDLRLLKLNEMFHCSKNSAMIKYFSRFLLFLLFINLFLTNK